MSKLLNWLSFITIVTLIVGTLIIIALTEPIALLQIAIVTIGGLSVMNIVINGLPWNRRG